jgi:hypothetical protein
MFGASAKPAPMLRLRALSFMCRENIPKFQSAHGADLVCVHSHGQVDTVETLAIAPNVPLQIWGRTNNYCM